MSVASPPDRASLRLAGEPRPERGAVSRRGDPNGPMNSPAPSSRTRRRLRMASFQHFSAGLRRQVSVWHRFGNDKAGQMKFRLMGVATAMLIYGLSPANAKLLKTSCQTMQRLAQEHANDMARRDRLDHAGFASRVKRGARAENVASGNSSRAMTIAQWRASPPHAANMLLPGCKGIASAVSRSGRHYWTMEIGQ